jgi:uncharacterized protein (DUF2164 family)
MAKKHTYTDIEITQEEKQQLMEEIKYYFKEERDEDLGILASENILEFFMNNLGKHIYNKALDDAKRWFDQRMENVEADYYAIYKR